MYNTLRIDTVFKTYSAGSNPQKILGYSFLVVPLLVFLVLLTNKLDNTVKERIIHAKPALSRLFDCALLSDHEKVITLQLTQI